MNQLQPQFIQQLDLNDPDWQHLCQSLQTATTLAAIVLSAWRMALWLAKLIVEQQLTERAQIPTEWSSCLTCGTPLVSKGFAKRQMLTLIGKIEWKRRIGRCPHQCLDSCKAPFDTTLNVNANQHTSTEVILLGCLLAVFLPFELAASTLQQLTGIAVSDTTIWNWVQRTGQQAKTQLDTDIQSFSNGELIPTKVLSPTLEAMPLVIAADGVTVPFRAHPNTSKGSIVWQEVKVALLARLGKHQTQTGETTTRLHQRRLVAVLGDIDDLDNVLDLCIVGENKAARIE